jgi:hypothetical protein
MLKVVMKFVIIASFMVRVFPIRIEAWLYWWRKPQWLAVIFSHHQVCVKRRREDTFVLPKVKVEFRQLSSLQKRFSLCSSHKIKANIVVFF